MSCETFEKKEFARGALVQAIEVYEMAAEAHGLSENEMIDEIQSACHEAGLNVEINKGLD